MRFPALLCLLALLASPLRAEPPCGKGTRKGEACTPVGRFAFTRDAAAPFTKLWVVWSYTVAGTPDSTIVIVKATGATDVRRKYTTASKTDSVDVGYPAPGAAKVINALAVAFKGGKSSDTVSLGGGTVQGDVPAPSGTLKLIPAAWTTRSDSAGVCASWQASHPGQTPWVVVNTTAVPACQTAAGPRIFQVCTVFLPHDGSTPVLCAPSGTACRIGTTPWPANVAQYCQGQYAAFLTARRS
jgi:hypothetical protein